MEHLSAADSANQLMVDYMIAEGALWSPPLIAAFRATPRHRFLDRIFQFQNKQDRWREILTREPGPQELRLVYSDRALITHVSSAKSGGAQVPTSSSSQPSLMAEMLEDLRLGPGLKVLEIGAGTGYNAALLAHVVGPDLVLSIDVDRSVLSEAWDHLRAYPERRVRVQQADGRLGFSPEAPFGRIIVTASTPDLEPAWLEQLAEGGILLAPLALAPGLAFIARGSVRAGVFEGRLTRAAYFMPLRAESEAGDSEEETRPSALLQSMPAPWADWFERRRARTSWLKFSQALAFFGYLHGLQTVFRTESDGQARFGAIDSAGDCCWFGPEQWQVNGRQGRNLGSDLWRGFLDAGGPWPTEYQLRAGRPGTVLRPGTNAYVLQAVKCEHVWEVIEPRQRINWI